MKHLAGQGTAWTGKLKLLSLREANCSSTCFIALCGLHKNRHLDINIIWVFGMFKRKTPKHNKLQYARAGLFFRYDTCSCLSVTGYVIWYTTKTHKMSSWNHFIWLLVRELCLNPQWWNQVNPTGGLFVLMPGWAMYHLSLLRQFVSITFFEVQLR